MTDEITVDVTEAQLDALLNGSRESVRVTESVKAPNTTPIQELQMDDEADIMGVVRNVNDVNTFDRDDGEQGRVRNIRIQDKTGDIRCALWGEHTEVDMNIGDYVHILSTTIEDGFQDTIEASVGWNSSIYVVDEPDSSDTFVTISVEEQ